MFFFDAGGRGRLIKRTWWQAPCATPTHVINIKLISSTLDIDDAVDIRRVKGNFHGYYFKSPAVNVAKLFYFYYKAIASDARARLADHNTARTRVNDAARESPGLLNV